MSEKNPYEDIIHLSRPTPKNHPRMSRLNRAAQFAPFAALTGYEDAVIGAAGKNEPSIVARYVIALATAFNKFYHKQRLLSKQIYPNY